MSPFSFLMIWYQNTESSFAGSSLNLALGNALLSQNLLTTIFRLPGGLCELLLMYRFGPSRCKLHKVVLFFPLGNFRAVFLLLFIGGTNPALRTLYYRLIRLLTLPILPLFVFDGPSRPSFKRNQRVAQIPAYITSRQQALISLFGFPYHTAPGEAEAECAHLQRLGVVDATLSEDVDTLMFGCQMLLKNWSSEGNAVGGVPTHVTVYELSKIEKERGLTPEGMIMAALMSGGDYIPAGVPRCGIRTAVDAARGGFGEDLCVLGAKRDEPGLKAWRERLTHELRTNDRKLFTRKNNRIVVPEVFPDWKVLGYYLNPVLSPTTADIVVSGPRWGEVDVPGLRDFVQEVFEWSGKAGVKKLMRTLAGGLLLSKLFKGVQGRCRQDTKVSELVEEFSGRRVHHSTNGIPELRVAYIPAKVVPIDIDAEPDVEYDVYGGDLGDYEVERAGAETEYESEQVNDNKKPENYNPTSVERVWASERILRLSVLERVEEWEERQNQKEKKKEKSAAKKTVAAGGSGAKAGLGTRKSRAKAAPEKDAGSIEKYLQVSKANSGAVAVEKKQQQFLTHPLSSSSPTSPGKLSTVILKATDKPTTKRRGKKVLHPIAKDSKVNPWSIAAKRAPGANNTAGLPQASADSYALSCKPQFGKSRNIPANTLTSPLRTLGKSRSPSPSETAGKGGRTRLALSRSRSPPASPELIPSSPPINYFPEEFVPPEWPPPIHLHREQGLCEPSPKQVEVVDLTSSPEEFSRHVSSPMPSTPSRIKKVYGLGPSSSKKLKASVPFRSDFLVQEQEKEVEEGEVGPFSSPSTISRRSSRRLSYGFIFPGDIHDESEFDYDGGSPVFGYDSHLDSYKQNKPHERSPESKRIEAIGKVNRILDFCPAPSSESSGHGSCVLPSQRPYLPPLNTGISTLPAPESSHSRNGSNTSNTTHNSTFSSFSDASTSISSPTTGRQPVRDFSWITMTRGNFSPRKQLKRVMEGVFQSALPQDSLESPVQWPEQTPEPTAMQKKLTPVEALQQIMHGPTAAPIQSPPGTAPPRLHSRSRATSCSSQVSISSSSVSLGPGFEPPTGTQQAPTLESGQKTPLRKMRSMIPIPSAKKSKPQPLPPLATSAPGPTAPIINLSVKGKEQCRQTKKPTRLPVPSAPALVLPPAKQPKNKKLSVRQSLGGTSWRELSGPIDITDANKTIGVKRGKEVSRQLRIWEDVDVVDLTGQT